LFLWSFLATTLNKVEHDCLVIDVNEDYPEKNHPLFIQRIDEHKTNHQIISFWSIQDHRLDIQWVGEDAYKAYLMDSEHEVLVQMPAFDYQVANNTERVKKQAEAAFVALDDEQTALSVVANSLPEDDSRKYSYFLFRFDEDMKLSLEHFNDESQGGRLTAYFTIPELVETDIEDPVTKKKVKVSSAQLYYRVNITGKQRYHKLPSKDKGRTGKDAIKDLLLKMNGMSVG